jgi:hypothetical protein
MRVMAGILILNLFLTISRAQTFNPETINGLPTKELYNLLVDSKGFLWVAHDFGVSRYDGLSFTNFANSQQTSLSMTDLTEDRQGRIWFHNFTGQIFYIENEKMILLEGYDFKKETYFPRILICNDELVATTNRGLFICNTTNLKFRYINIKDLAGNIEGTRSISKINNTIVAHSEKNWYKYSQNEGIKKIDFIDKNNLTIKEEILILQIFADKDTVFLTGTPSATLYKLVLKDKSVNLVSKEKMKSFINNVTQNKNHYWVNTRNSSFTTDKEFSINNYNLTDIITDKEGNTWFSSLTKGLLVKFKPQTWKINHLKFLKENDFIKAIYKANNLTIYGTQKGEIILEDSNTNKSLKRFDLSQYDGDIENIYHFSKNKFLIKPPVGLYMLDAGLKKIENITNSDIIKDVIIYNDAIFLATTRGIRILPLEYAKNPSKEWREKMEKGFGLLKTDTFSKKIYINKMSRCRAICFDSTTQTLFAAFTDGLYKINSHGLHAILDNNLPVYASSLAFANGKLFVSTFNNSLIVFNQGIINRITVAQGLTSSAIIKMKVFNDHLWVLGEGVVQVLSIEKESIIKNISLPSLAGTYIYDIDEEKNIAYFTTSTGLYEIGLYETNNSFLQPLYLLYSLVNNKDTLIPNNPTLRYNQNDIKFILSSPSYANPQRIAFNYRLLGGTNEKWESSTPGQRFIHYPSLSPGDYIFEAISVNFQGETAKKPVSFSFHISKPLWQQWWFYGIIIMVAILGIFYLVQQRIKNIRNKNKLTIEKLNLEKNLSNSRLTAIKSQLNPHFIFNTLNTIQSYIFTNEKQVANTFLGKLSDLMRRILAYSEKNYISLEQEIEMLQLYIDLELLRHNNNFTSSIQVSPLIDPTSINLPPMLLQPYVENAIKHGLLHKAINKKLVIIFTPAKHKDFLEIIIDDNGIGRNNGLQLKEQINNKHISFANKANETRINIINQNLNEKIILNIIDKKDDAGFSIGTVVQIFIPYKEIVNSLI